MNKKPGTFGWLEYYFATILVYGRIQVINLNTIISTENYLIAAAQYSDLIRCH